jgi:hypothetical protein
MGRRSYRRGARRREASAGCLGILVRFSVALLLIGVLYAMLARPQMGVLIGDEIARRSGLSAEAALDGLSLGPAADLIASLPSDPIQVTQEEANTYIDTYLQSADTGPLDDLTLRFEGDRVEATVQAFGGEGVVSAVPIAQDGQLVLLDPRLDGALGIAVSAEDLAETLTDEANAALARQGRFVEDVRVEDGAFVLILGNR